MGTLFYLTLYAPSQDQAEQAADAAFHRIAQLENIMSDYQADSELNLLREKPVGQPTPVSEDLFRILDKSLQLARLSEGAFDPTVGPYVRLWRFSRKRKVLPSPAEVERARASVGWRKLSVDATNRSVALLAPGMQLDLGGIAKGFAADEALAVLKRAGIESALVAASGDIVVGAPPPGQPGWRVQIAGVPGQTNSVPPLLLKYAAVSTSGDTEQFIEIDGVRYSHIVSPSTGLGLTEHLQVSVLAPNATTTDGLATAVSVMGRDRGLKLIDSLPDVSALLIIPTNSSWQIQASKQFPTMVK